MTETRIKISSIVENQLPQFVSEEFPLVSEFLSQYYTSLESQGNVSDLLQNIDQYIKVDRLTNLIDSTTLTSDVTFFDPTINVVSTAGFPDSYGLLLIGSEVITYTSKTSTTFNGCIRGFSGVTSYSIKDELTFSETQAEEHLSTVDGKSTVVTNLSVIFLKEFFKKVKKQITPGFEDRELYSDLNERLFIKQSIDFYSSKGTDDSFKILFAALYGENVEVIKPRDYLIRPSDSQYRITSDLVVEQIEGDPESLVNMTLYQNDAEGTLISQGTITQVEKIRRGSKNYYVISLDSGYDRDIQAIGSIYGKFKIHPKTRTVNIVSSESTTIEVDSTVSFPNSNGTLVVDLENGTSLNITYKSKTLNQFLDCQGISQDIPESTEIKTNEFAYGYAGFGNTNQVKVRITGVLSELNLPSRSIFYSEGDSVRIKSLGLNSKDFKSNNWFFNTPVKYVVSGISISDKSDKPLKGKSYEITLFDDHSFKIGDSVTFIPSAGNVQSSDLTCDVIYFNNEKSFTVQFGANQSELDPNSTYIVKKNLSKVSSENYPSVSKFTSNVQNVYLDDVGSLYVSSPSLPTYLNVPLKINDRSVVFSGTFVGETLDIGNHGFYTGDSIVYKPTADNTLGISTGIYFIKVVSNTQVKLARSRNNIFTNNFVLVSGSVNDAKFEIKDFTYRDLSTQLLESQKLIRKIANPEIDKIVHETNPGLTGIFVNGVELLNYKSKDNVYYGSIQSIISSAPGSGYDVINPPILSISDPVGSGASAHCSIIGGLERIDIVDPGFDYIEEPVIEITGGNGSGATAKVNLVDLEHTVEFNSQSTANLVKLNPINIVGFSSYHKFRNAEEVIYVTDGQKSVGGLTTNSSYFVSVQDLYNVKLHESYLDAVAGINTIQLTSYGTGNHSIRSKNLKRKIGSITVVDSGSNYQNKLTITNSSGINTASNTVLIPNHGYESGEIITYSSTGTPIGGLASSTSYYVTKITDDEFKLSAIGVGNSDYLYFNTKQYIDLTTGGNGEHRFNYPEIKVSVKGRIGVATFSDQNFNAVLQPIFRGEVQSVFVSSKGAEYGSEEIINHNRQPLFELNSGSGAELTPIISNGRIVNVLVKHSGSGYNSPPNLQVNGVGSGVILTPIISNGNLIEVKVINSGTGYRRQNTTITVNSSGTGSRFEAKIQSWKINLVQRLITSSKVSDDDGILSEGLNGDYGLQYTHAYAPRRLRRSVQATNFRKGRKIFIPDLQEFEGKELTSDSHSPIIGWAYDGNPIYGPYGYTSKTGGSIRALRSGYQLELKPNRPKTSIYPQGFFIEDYTYFADKDLDEHNGRFGITPEYPNGVYAYFATINSGLVESTGFFAGYKRPTFPYVIGPTYKSKPIDFNFAGLSNQDYIDINQTLWKRNISSYNPPLYDYFFNPNDVRNQTSVVRNVSGGYLNYLKIKESGQNYKIGDQITLDDRSGNKSRAKVSLINGKSVNKISVATSSVENVQLYPDGQRFIGFSTIPHNFLNNDLVTFTGENDYKKFANIIVKENNLTISSGVGSTRYTGLVTYFNVTGNLNYPTIRENDIYQINDEQVKILNVDTKSSRIRVIRNQNGTTGITSYKIGTYIVEKPRKFGLNFGISTTYNFSVDREYYFDPKESVGLGTRFGVGIVSTIYFSNPGAGITQINIPTRSIYIQNHNLITNNSLIYSSNGGNRISVSTNGTSTFQLENNSIVYAVKISNDLIGISTVPVGVGSTGNFVAIGSSSTQNPILSFTSVGTGNTHSFKTNFSSTLLGDISKNVVTVSTAETHGLSSFDKVILSVRSGISTTVIVKYNDYNRRLTLNPRAFTSIDINTNIITINRHGYYNGQKVIYTSTSPSIGLVNEGIYYVVVIDSNKIKLSNSFYEATKPNPEVIDIRSSSSGFISPINPPLTLTRNQKIIFDLSDSSLSYNNNSIKYSAFDFKFYKDEEFKEEFNTTNLSSTFEVVGLGSIGIGTGAKIELTLNDNVPTDLYYTLVPINLKLNLQVKKDIIRDSDVIGSNKITLQPSLYDGTHTIVAISSSTFNYNVLGIPESPSYLNNTENDIQYYTDSPSAKGSIRQISISKSGEYKSLPNTISILSEEGSDAILEPNSGSIGKVKNVEIEDIGFDYSSDYSIRPIAKFSSFLILESLYSFDRIGISSLGRNYNTAPTLVVIDGLTNRVIDDVDLSYKLGDSEVTIERNTISLNGVTPKIIPTNNSNGIKIKNIVFNSTSKDVTVTLGASFSDLKDYPFAVGSKVFIENTSVGIATTGKGYNSANYDYALFTLTAVTPSLGGAVGVVTYNLSSHLKSGEVPGKFNATYSVGKIIAESDFPIFNPVIKNNNFISGETVYSLTSIGKVESWDDANQYLKVSTIDDFSAGEVIIGETTNSIGLIKEVLSFETDYKVDATSLVKKGWYKETGFLNSDIQRIHDSDYYQYFSYSLKSKKDFNTWDNPVSSLNHTAGFKKFSDLIIESKAENVGILTDQNQGDFLSIVDLSRVVDLNCVYDYDLALENNLSIDGIIKSHEISFNSRVIQDYIDSIGNRVLMIDDISDEFNSNPRSTPFSVISSFNLNDFRSQKYFIAIKDRKTSRSNEIQASLISLIHDGSNGFINQYGMYSSSDLGFFDFNVIGNNGNLLFYPTKFEVNDYYTSNLSFSLTDIVSGVGTTDLGSSVRIETTTSTIPTGTSAATTIVSVASTYRSSKVLVQIGATNSSYYEYDEITYIHNGSEVFFINYGQLTTNSFAPTSTSGIGTYNAYISSNNVVIDLIPDSSTTVDYVVNTFNISIANTSLNGVGIQTIGGASLDSSSVEILSSASPIPNIIASYPNSNNDCSYLIISVEDKTNSQYQISEVLTITDFYNSKCYMTEFAILNSANSLGVTTAFADTSGEITKIYFTPNPDIDVDVKVFQIALSLNDTPDNISLTNGGLYYDYGTYVGIDNDIRKNFDLTYRSKPIFQKYFNGSRPSVVKTSTDVIRIPNHFFVTGEEVQYSYFGDGSTAIGIATTSIPGVGVTDILPSTLYIVKISDVDLQVASSASNALKSIPTVLDITSVGTGPGHIFTSKKSNSKSIITIDNVIQSPVTGTSVTTTLSKTLGIFESDLSVSGITSIFGGDLIKIDDEIMRVVSVGVGSTNAISVSRPWLGTGISTHASSSLVTKILANYNIVDNTIYFDEAPYGKVPIIGQLTGPDEVDYVGIITGSTFSGRVFLRSGEKDTSTEPYANNYIFDSISNNFNGKDKSFTLKSNGSNVTGMSTDNSIVLVNSIFQGPNSPGGIIDNYDLVENAGITSITFIGNSSPSTYDVNTASIPRGGIILSIGSTQGFGYQPLVAAGGTATVSAAGTIQSISIGNSGSGYRVGIQTFIRVGVKTESTGIPNIEFIGTAAVSNGRIVSIAITNPGVGYTSSNPPIVVFDPPLSYSNIPLVYSSKSTSGVGTGAIVDITVGQGSSVISFELKNLGYGYKPKDILTVSIGGTAGIPTNTSLSFSEFQITVDKIQSDNFAAWSVGRLQVIDPLDDLFDGSRTRFPILIDGNQTTIRSKKLTKEEIQATLLVFINDVLQVPGEGYTFKGGSIIRFTEAPKQGDTSRILFYRGTADVDTQDIDILETIKVGDSVTLKGDTINLTENDRIVTEIISSDSVNTNLYPGPGITEDEALLRSLMWCRQTEDLIINGFYVGKDRIIYEPYIQPNTNIIQNVSTGSTEIFVESIKTFFDNEREYVHDGTTEKPQNKILIISQDTTSVAIADAVVSSSGTISSIDISDGGVGYSTAPTVIIAGPIGFGTTTAQNTAKASATISEGVVTGIAVTFSGIGYSSSEPPDVLIESPTFKYESIDKVSYEGDFGIITGIKTTSIGVAATGIIFDFFIPRNSVLRDGRSAKVGIATTGISGIQTGYYFVVSNSNVGNGLTSLNSSGGVVGVGTTFIDNIYQVASVSIGQTAVPGIGITNVAQVTVSVLKYNGLTGLGFSEFYGEYSWGRILTPIRLTPKQFTTYANIGGISTSPIVQRFNRLKYTDYSTS